MADITDPKYKRFESFNNTETTSEYKQNQAIHIATTVLDIVGEGLERSGYRYFDHRFLADPYNSAMHSAYENARAICPDDLDVALERAWAVRRRDWEARAAIPGHRVQPDDDEVATEVTDASHERGQLLEPDGDGTPEGLFVKLKATISSILALGKSSR
jgi:hypothetical protein